MAIKKYLRVVLFIHAARSETKRQMPPITFPYSDFQGVDPNQDNPIVITMELENFVIKNVLVDQGSLVDIIY